MIHVGVFQASGKNMRAYAHILTIKGTVLAEHSVILESTMAHELISFTNNFHIWYVSCCYSEKSSHFLRNCIRLGTFQRAVDVNE